MSARGARSGRDGALCLLALPLLAGCGAPTAGDSQDARQTHGTLQQAIRPTDGTGWKGNGYEPDAVIKAYDPPGGHFRVHYAINGMSAVDLTDTDPSDGVPDFVNRVGTAAEQTYQSTVISRGFRPPLDDSIYHDTPDFGGDGRFDIYLRLAGAGSDGYRVIEVCTDGSDGTAPDRCAGYFVMNPSFAGSTYKTELDGIQVLTSHELFHAIQDAYGTGQWRTFTEGTAVWNELQVFPRTPDHAGTWTDYQGFARALFAEPERPLDQSMGTGPASAYAYAVAVWFEFLSERFGPQLIRELWEGSQAEKTGQPTQFLDVTTAVLSSHYQTDLGTVFGEFAQWNLLTGPRAVDSPAAPPAVPHGYKSAAEYPQVRLEPPITQLAERHTVSVVGLSARYFELAIDLTAPKRLRLHVSDPSQTPAVGTLYVVPAGSMTPGPAMVVTGTTLDVDVMPGQSLLLVVAGTTRGAAARDVTVYLDTDVAVPPAKMHQGADGPAPMIGGGCSVSPTAVPPVGALWPLLAVALLRRRRLARG